MLTLALPAAAEGSGLCSAVSLPAGAGSCCAGAACPIAGSCDAAASAGCALAGWAAGWSSSAGEPKAAAAGSWDALCAGLALRWVLRHEGEGRASSARALRQRTGVGEVAAAERCACWDPARGTRCRRAELGVCCCAGGAAGVLCCAGLVVCWAGPWAGLAHGPGWAGGTGSCASTSSSSGHLQERAGSMHSRWVLIVKRTANHA